MSRANEKAGFVEIKDVLKKEVERFSSINQLLQDQSDEFNKIDEKYTSYGTEMDTAKSHIIKLKRREFFENLFIYIGITIYFACVTYVMLKRFPIHRIVFFLYSVLEMILESAFNFKDYIMKISVGVNNNNTLGNITIQAIINDTLTQYDYPTFDSFNDTPPYLTNSDL